MLHSEELAINASDETEASEICKILERDIALDYKNLVVVPPDFGALPDRLDSQDSDLVPRIPIADQFYPQQKKVALELFRKIMIQIENDGGSSRFKSFRFVIQLPEHNSLYSQTMHRLTSFIGRMRAEKEEFFADLDADKVVYKGITSEKQNDVFDRIKKLIKEERETLFLIVHDEAHWSPTKNRAGSRINHEDLRCSANVHTLFVSATPYNLLTCDSQVLANMIVK
jgi:hypothetical protein